jgi:cell division protein FtsW
MAQTVKTDKILFGTILAMVCAGILVLTSASSAVGGVRFGSAWHFVGRQLFWAVLALAALMALKSIDYRRLDKGAWVFCGVSVALGLLILVYFLDPRAHRWFRLGWFSFQPSVLAKPVLILFLAHFASRRTQLINKPRTLMCAAAIVGLVAGAVVAADLGTAVVLAVTAAAVFYVAGLKWRYAAVAGVILLIFIAGAVAVKPYRIARVFGHVDPEYRLLDTALVRHFDPEGRLKAKLQREAPTRDSSYHINQSLIAVGSGGPLGVGPMHSRAKLFYLPEAHTDFIYAVVAEELGLWGALAFAGGFLVIFWRGLRIHFRTPDDFGRYAALGVATMVTVQALLNLSVVIGLLPTKGIPLPLVSYGGSSLLFTMASLGLLLSVGDHSG